MVKVEEKRRAKDKNKGSPACATATSPEASASESEPSQGAAEEGGPQSTRQSPRRPVSKNPAARVIASRKAVVPSGVQATPRAKIPARETAKDWHPHRLSGTLELPLGRCRRTDPG
jgi:hypothetical protein